MWETARTILAVIGAIAGIGTALAAVVQGYRHWKWKRQLTWNDALRVAEALLERIERSAWRPDLVLGLGRSGGLWGGWLAGNLGSLPFAVVDDRYERTDDGLAVDFPAAEAILRALREHHGTGLDVLVVEGATSGGATPNAFRDRFASLLEDWDVRFAVLYRNPASAASVDFVGMEGPEPWPERFPWHGRQAYRPHLRDLFPRRRAA